HETVSARPTSAKGQGQGQGQGQAFRHPESSGTARPSRLLYASASQPNLRRYHSMSLPLTSSGFSCWVPLPDPSTRYFSSSVTSFSIPSPADGGSTASFSALIISDGARTVKSRVAYRSQLRVKLRYQLMPPVK